MRSDAGINGDAQCIEQMTWMFFLKGYDTQEETWEYKAYKEKKEYNSIIPESLRRRVSAQQKFPGGYSDPYGAVFSLIQNRTDDFSSSFAPLRRKALQPSPQTFATAPANVCNRSRKRLREKPSFSIRPRKYVHPSPQVRATVPASTCV